METPKIPEITQRAQSSPLWECLSTQQGKTLPFLLERYLLLENWNREKNESQPEDPIVRDEINYVHLLLADVAVTLLDQEARLRKLEETQKNPHS